MTPTHEQRFLVWTIVASQFAPPFMFAGVAVALPSMGAELGAGAIVLGLVETLFLAGSVAFLLPAGRLADAGDKRTLYKLGLVGFCLASIGIGLVSSTPAILFLRFVQGLMSALYVATGPAILADLVPAPHRGRVYGMSLGAIYAGLMLGPIGAGLLIDAWNWRAVFLVGAFVLLAMAAAIHAMMPSTPRLPLRAVHLPSAALLVTTMLGLVAGAAFVGQGRWAYAVLAGTAAVGAAFLLLQRRIARPLLDLADLAGNAVLRNALLIQLLIYMNAFCTAFMLSIYLQVSLGRSARVTGQLLAVGSILMAVLAPFAGRLADRLRPSGIASAGVACIWISAMLALRLDLQSGLGYVVAILAVQGVGFALFSSPNLTIIMNSVGASALSMASALAAQSRSLGMISGMLMTSLLISLNIGNDPVAEHPALFAETMAAAFRVLAVLSGIAFAVSLIRSGGRPGEAPGRS
jgi:MFS family permease